MYHNLAEVYASRQLFAARGGAVPSDYDLSARLNRPLTHVPDGPHRDIEYLDTDIRGACQGESNLRRAGERIREVPRFQHGKTVRGFDGKAIGSICEITCLILDFDTDVVRAVVKRSRRYEGSERATLEDSLTRDNVLVSISQGNHDTRDTRQVVRSGDGDDWTIRSYAA